jgi:hypothetical protein
MRRLQNAFLHKQTGTFSKVPVHRFIDPAQCDVSTPFGLHPQGVGRGCKGHSPRHRTHSLSNHERHLLSIV